MWMHSLSSPETSYLSLALNSSITCRAAALFPQKVAPLTVQTALKAYTRCCSRQCSCDSASESCRAVSLHETCSSSLADANAHCRIEAKVHHCFAFTGSCGARRQEQQRLGSDQLSTHKQSVCKMFIFETVAVLLPSFTERLSSSSHQSPGTARNTQQNPVEALFRVNAPPRDVDAASPAGSHTCTAGGCALWPR